MRSCPPVPIRLSPPLDSASLSGLICGSQVLLTGTVLLARDTALRRIAEEIENGKALPFSLEGAVLFFGGFTPPPPGRTVGSIGPTTSRRMTPSALFLLKAGVKGMIGKGKWSPEAVLAFREAGAVYFGATGGAAAFLSRSVRSLSFRMVADPDQEAPALLEVVDLPLIVAIDTKGNDLFEEGRRKYIKGTDQAQKNIR